MSKKAQKIEAISIQHNASVLDALKQMDQTYKRLLLVFNEKRFINVLSIGDIQRAIIRNQPLEIPLNEILRKETRVAYHNDTFEYIKTQMLKYKAECMPVLNDNNQLVDVHFWEDIFTKQETFVKTKLNLPVVIMAGGKGTRMKPLTNVIPKPLIPLGEKTIIEEIMDRFIQYNCNSFFLSINYKADTIKHYFSQVEYPYNIHYFQEDKPLGTAGSLHLLNKQIATPFFVTNCDIIIEEDYAEIYNYHQTSKNELTIIAALKHYPIPYGTIETGANGALEKLSEKPELTFKINSGMYILEPHLLKEIPENIFFHITDLIEKIKNRGGKVGVFPVSQNSWKDIGNWEEYIKHIRE
ncbi:MAG: nucleotidyltransferase family protein [Bacteroidales bacterium]|nr:nucleotidyltransferase family protein [Bacteroidales bacterium]